MDYVFLAKRLNEEKGLTQEAVAVKFSDEDHKHDKVRISRLTEIHKGLGVTVLMQKTPPFYHFSRS